MNLFQFVSEECVESHHQPGPAMAQASGGARLYVTELVVDLDEALRIDDLDGELIVSSEPADDHARHLELVRVVNLARARLDTELPMGIQGRLDALLAKLRKIKWDVATLLLFGSAADCVSKREKHTKATLIAFRTSDPPSAETKESLLAAIRRTAGGSVIFRKRSN